MLRAIGIILLCALPFLAIGFFAGMCYAKASYFQTIRWQRKQIRHIQRNARFAIEKAANLAFDAGYKEFIVQSQRNEN